MRVDEKFNKRTAALIEVQQPVVDSKLDTFLGVRVRLFTCNEKHSGDGRELRMHMTPEEALRFAESLLAAARERLYHR